MRFIRDIINEKKQAAGGSDIICPPVPADLAGETSLVPPGTGRAGRRSLLILPVADMQDTDNQTTTAECTSEAESDDRPAPVHSAADAEPEDNSSDVVLEEEMPEPSMTGEAAFDFLDDGEDGEDEPDEPVDSLFAEPEPDEFESVEDKLEPFEPPHVPGGAISQSPDPLPGPPSPNLVQDIAPEALSVPSPAPGRTARRAGRVKTRLLGFGAAQEVVKDPMATAANAPAEAERLPVGWMTVTDGPGRGAVITLFDGVSQIGRGEDQAVRLDFGDTSISRSNHAAMAYDSEQRAFFVGHGGKANLVRLNDRPVLSTETMQSGDRLRIGETTLRFVALCGTDFDWAGDAPAGTDRVQHG